MKATDFMGEGWSCMDPFFQSDYMKNLAKKLSEARKTKTIYPAQADLFRAFKLTPFEKVRVIWLGQDPYNSPNEATGLSFDCSRVSLTPSMRKIIDGYTQVYPNSFNVDLMDGNLTPWANQGVLLINAALTVRKHEPGSHMGHWRPFTLEVLRLLSEDPVPKAFVALGKFAEELIRPFAVFNHRLFVREHPAYAARQARPWVHENLFEAVNAFLESRKINW